MHCGWCLHWTHARTQTRTHMHRTYVFVGLPTPIRKERPERAELPALRCLFFSPFVIAPGELVAPFVLYGCPGRPVVERICGSKHLHQCRQRACWPAVCTQLSTDRFYARVFQQSFIIGVHGASQHHT